MATQPTQPLIAVAMTDLGTILDGIADVLYGLCRTLQMLGIPRDHLVAMLDALIADANVIEGAETKRAVVPQAIRAALLRWQDEPPGQRARLTLIEGGKPPDNAA